MREEEDEWDGEEVGEEGEEGEEREGEREKETFVLESKGKE